MSPLVSLGLHDEGLATRRFRDDDGEFVTLYENVFYNNRNWSGLFFASRCLELAKRGIQRGGGAAD